MNKELKVMRSNAETITKSIDTTRSLAKNNPESLVDYAKILKAQNDLLDAIHDRICDIVINDTKLPFWKKLFRK